MRLFIGIFFSLILALPTMASDEKYSESDLLDRPLMERYILDELKALREKVSKQIKQTHDTELLRKVSAMLPKLVEKAI